jgi:hypothetical protein
MRLQMTGEQAALIGMIRSFLDEHWDRDEPPVSEQRRFEFLDALDNQGWSVPNWPLDQGGCDWTVQERFLLDRELARSRAPVPDPFLVDLAGPLIIEAGSARLKAECLPSIRAGRASWCSALNVDPLPARRHSGSLFRLGRQHLQIRGAVDATHLVVLVDPDGRTPTLGLVDLRGPDQTIRMDRGLPLDPDHVQIEDADVVIIGQAGQGRRLLDEQLNNARNQPRSRVTRTRAKLRRLEDHFREFDDPSLEACLQEVEIGLLGLDVLEQRSLTDQGDSAAVRAAIRVKLRELDREISYAAVTALGYYALPSFDSKLMGNEGRPGPGVGSESALNPGWDAIEELFGYVGSLEDMTDRDRIAVDAFGEGVGSGQGT